MNVKYSSAFSLTELIVATTVISIIMLGVVTSNMALQQSSKDFSTSYYNNQITTTTLNHILLNASKAVGDVGRINGVRNLGVAIGTTTQQIGWDSSLPVDNPSSRIFNRPVVGGANPTVKDNTFCIYQGAAWVCYTLRTNNLHFCTKNSPEPCEVGDPVIGTARTVTPSFNVTSRTDANNPSLGSLFTVTIENCPDPRFNECGPGNVSNPYIQKTGNVSPAAQSAS